MNKKKTVGEKPKCRWCGTTLRKEKVPLISEHVRQGLPLTRSNDALMTNGNSPRDGTTATRVVRFMIDTLNRLSAAHDSLRREPAGGASTVLLTGLLVTLASLRESIRIARGLEPNLQSVIDRYEERFELWHQMRHDAAHAPERIFYGPLHPSNNNPAIPSGVKVIGYDPLSDHVSTGINVGFILGDEILIARQIITECKPVVGLP